MTCVAIWEGVVEGSCGPKAGYWFYSSNDGLESFWIGQLVALLLAALVAIALMLPIVVAAFMTSEANDWFLPIAVLLMLLGMLVPQLQVTRPNKWWRDFAGGGRATHFGESGRRGRRGVTLLVGL